MPTNWVPMHSGINNKGAKFTSNKHIHSTDSQLYTPCFIKKQPGT